MAKKGKKIALNKYSSLGEVEYHLNNNEEVTLFIDNIRKYVTVGFDASSIRIADFGHSGEFGSTLLNSNLPSEYYYGKTLYFVTYEQFAELFNPFIISGRLGYCTDNIAPYSIY